MFAIIEDNGGIDFFPDVMSSLGYTFESYTFKHENDSINGLISDALYGIPYVISLVLFVAGLYFTFIVAFFERWINYIRNKNRVKKALKSNCDIIIGLNSLEDYISNHDKNSDFNIVVWSNDIDKQLEKSFIIRTIPFIRKEFTCENLKSIPFDNDLIIITDDKKEDNKFLRKPIENNVKYNFISFDEENINVNLIFEFINFLKEGNRYQTQAFDIYVELGLDNLDEIQNKILAFRENDDDVTITPYIHCFNRYELNAILMSEKYPITKFLPKGFVDTEIGAIRMEPIEKTETFNKRFSTISIPNGAKNLKLKVDGLKDPIEISLNEKNKHAELWIEGDFIYESKKKEPIVLEISGMKHVVEQNYSKMINTVFLGYGKISKELYRCFVMNNQLPSYQEVLKTKDKDGNELEKPILMGELHNHLINYFLFDKTTLLNEGKDNIYYHKKQFRQENNNEYYEMPEDTHRVYSCPCDVNSSEVLEALIKISLGEEKYTSIIVSLGTDLDNINYALRINSLFKQMGIANYHIFVRISNQTQELEEYLNDHFTFFGSVSKLINHEVIINEDVYKIAKHLNSEYNNKNKNVRSKNKWHQLDSVRQKSNLFAAINLRLKLNLIGYDFKEGKDKPLNYIQLQEELMKKLEYKKACYDDYLFFEKEAPYKCANILAYQEKLRWNSNYITNGYVPHNINHICEVNGKLIKDDIVAKTHACLTSYRGLDAYHNRIGKESQTYKYDYDLIDSLDDIFFKDEEYVIYKLYEENVVDEDNNSKEDKKSK